MATPVPSTPLVVPVQPVAQQPLATLRYVKGLAVTQFIIGVISVILGVAVIVSQIRGNIRMDYTGAAMWASGWIGITGMIGLCHAKNGRNNNCLYMTFNIISSCASALAGLIAGLTFNNFLSSICDFDYYRLNQYCTYMRVCVGLYAPFMILMIIEFVVSIVAAVLCCKNNGCRGCECCCNGQPDMVIHQQPYIPVATTLGGPTVATAGGGYPTNDMYGPSLYGGQMMPQYGVQMQPQYNTQAPQQYATQMQPSCPPQQPAIVSHGTGQQTNVIYVDKPPAYNEI